VADEATLLRRVQDCDANALAQVYDSYYERIYRYVYRYVGQAGPAEDLTANVFLRLLNAVRSGRSPRKNLSAWLYRVAHNLVVDMFRHKPSEDVELTEWIKSYEPDMAHLVDENLQMEQVRRALRQLTQNQQQVVVLKFLQGMSSREVAAILGKTEGAIDALQHRGLVALRKALKGEQGPGAKGQAMRNELGKRKTSRNTDTEGHPMTAQALIASVRSLGFDLVSLLRTAPTKNRERFAVSRIGARLMLAIRCLGRETRSDELVRQSRRCEPTDPTWTWEVVR